MVLISGKACLVAWAGESYNILEQRNQTKQLHVPIHCTLLFIVDIRWSVLSSTPTVTSLTLWTMTWKYEPNKPFLFTVAFSFHSILSNKNRKKNTSNIKLRYSFTFWLMRISYSMIAWMPLPGAQNITKQSSRKKKLFTLWVNCLRYVAVIAETQWKEKFV